jgi:hypothetical protein
MLKRMTLLACLLCLLTAAPALAEEKVDLEAKFQPGTYWMSNFSNIGQTIDMGGQTMKQTINMLMVMKMDVSEADAEGNRIAKLTYERIVQNMDMMGGQMKMSFDSDKPDNNSPLAMAMAPLTKATFTMTIDKDNKVAKVEGFKELLADMQKNNPQAANMLKQMEDSFSGDQLKQMVAQGTQGLPEKPVAVEDNWQQKTEMPMPQIGEIELNVDYVLEDVIEKSGRKLAEISFKGDGELKEADQENQEPMQFSKMKIDQEGRIFFDIEKGRAVRSELNQKMTMAAKAVGNNQGPAMNMTQDMRSVILHSESRMPEAEKKYLTSGKLPEMK